MTIPFQIAQKLHGASQAGSSRVRDLIDLQLIINSENVDFGATANICRRLFSYRRMQPWPPRVTKGADWDGVYANQRGSLPVCATCNEAVNFVNELIEKIDKS